MEQKVLEEVMKSLMPHFRLVSTLVAKRDLAELKSIKNRIIEGKQKGVVIFYPKDETLDIDLKYIAKEKGSEWALLLEKQLDILNEMIEKFT